ncbi:MAG: hypothetical protein ACOC8O_01290, partial [Natronomonas sp.]
LVERIMGTDPHKGITPFHDEEVLVNSHAPLDRWWKSILVGGFFLFTPLQSGTEGLLGALMVSIPIFAYVYKSWDEHRYIVTSQRIKTRKGILRTSEDELRIGDARTVSTSDRGFRSGGNVSIRTNRQTMAKFGPMMQHKEFADAIRKQIRRYEHGESKGGRDQVEIVDPSG